MIVDTRRTRSGDLVEVAKVWHESASHMDGAALPMPLLKALRERIDRELDAGWELYIAECNGRSVGMLAIRPHDAVLDQIFVLTTEQAKGVGTCLLAVAKRAMPQGFTLRMASTNLKAARFYERSGLCLLREERHPISGAPVRYYGWKG